MPLLKIVLSEESNPEQTTSLLSGGTRIIVEVMNRPERAVMVVCETEPMMFAASREPCAFVELRAIGGLDPDTNITLTERLCALLDKSAGIPPNRTFVTFHDLPRTHWGWNSNTFAT